MTLTNLQPEKQPQIISDRQDCPETKTEKILCQHCGRTATNGIKCRGICVADSDY
jgi:hypothetical protein